MHVLTNAKAYTYQVGGACLTMELLLHLFNNAKAYIYINREELILLWSY